MMEWSLTIREGKTILSLISDGNISDGNIGENDGMVPHNFWNAMHQIHMCFANTIAHIY
jgi:hypothetical protein